MTKIAQVEGELYEGGSVVTSAGNLYCRKIIHTCGPMYANFFFNKH